MFGVKYSFGKAQKIVKSHIDRKRFLLVLDDVRNENSELWFELKELLALGEKGSRVLITSRSKKVAKAIGNCPIYELQGLSEDSSWELFRRMAFKQGEELEDPNLVDIGKVITKKCANIPLCIRVIGSLLYGQDKNNWLWLKSNDFAKMRLDEENGIMSSALIFSYNQLSPESKSCFSFCSPFPKDYVMKKDVVVNLWLAQGYLVSSHEDQSIGDVGEEYFSVLLRRCFFHDIERDEYGEVHSFKMHDLIHDLAQEVAGKEFLMLTYNTNHFRGGIRHLSTASSAFSENWFSLSYCSNVRLRTFFQLYSFYKTSGDVGAILSNCRRLRVLDLHDLAIETLPNTLGKLLHLRYLDLSCNRNMEMLPTSITKLHNLQILKLCRCEKLKQLPEDMSKLVNLRMLDLDRCHSLTHMPAGMDDLKCLHTLTKFLVGGGDVSSRVKKGELIDLKALVNLKGGLCIEVGEFSTKCKPNVVGGDYIKNAHLKALEIKCEESDDCSVHETLLECLHPNHDLSKILMEGYQGIKLPTWASLMEASLPWLVSIMLTDLNELQHLPSLSGLCHLKYLQLLYLLKVEHIESDAAYASVLMTTFFPSLEKLTLFKMPQLKGWWRGLSWVEMEAGGGCLVNDNGTDVILPSFPHLRELIVGHFARA
ncbi:disease resistance protein RGA2-like [Chenopodium quinoa]|uniref:disease resistance protein RGA2-like n=1 Tax=Chenopodium quinoa TaxID=63459 RepID=UPI000B78B660|nr:disease resistance protein RGA2-like [Chenopodium quinoa]